MKKNKLIPFSLSFIALVFLEFFCIVKYSDVYYFPLCVGLTLIGSAYLLFTEMEHVVNNYLKESEKASKPDEATVARREEASKIAKATYVLEKRILNLLDERILTPEENMDNLSSLEGDIVHAIKASIKYGRDNTNHLSEVISEASASTADYESILAKLDELILVLKNNQIATSPVYEPVHQVGYGEVQAEPMMTQEPEMTAAEAMIEEPEMEVGLDSEEAPEYVDTLTVDAAPEIEPDIEIAPEPAPTAPVDSDPNKPMSPEDIAALIAAAEAQSETEIETEIEVAPEPVAPVNDDPNKPMSPEDIAALIAAAEAQSETEIETEIEVAPEPVATVNDDPNKPMSPEDIAALIAAAESGAALGIDTTPEPATQPAPQPKDDPNRQMSPEDIAALFASSNLELDPEPTATSHKTAIEALSKHETSPASDDPNKPMSPDDIAALIASLGQ